MRSKSKRKKAARKSRHPAVLFLDGLWRARVPYVLVGVTGLNYYARDPGEAYGTQDIDVFVKPERRALRLTYQEAKKAGFDITHDGKPVRGPDQMAQLAGSVCPILLIYPDIYLTVDVLQCATGMTFDEFHSGHSVFKTAGSAVRVASLRNILKSKKLAGREKDITFLNVYKTDLLDRTP